MRFLILSDIHGSRPILEKVMKFYDNGHYDMLLLLGDLLNLTHQEWLKFFQNTRKTSLPLGATVTARSTKCSSPSPS